MIKCLVGYDLMPGITPEEYDRWIWDIHVPDLMANPYLDKIVFNTVIEQVTTASSNTVDISNTVKLYRVAEMHYQDIEAYRNYRAWFDEHPIPVERGPGGRSDFKFYLLCESVEALRDGSGYRASGT